MRASLAEYNGSRFISLRVWTHDSRTGAWYPDKAKGCTIRLSEAAEIAAAIAEGLEMAGGAPEPRAKRAGPPDRSREWSDRPRPEVPLQPGATPPWANRPQGRPQSGEDVDEF